MIVYVLRRLLAILAILAVMSMLIFMVTQVLPGNVAYIIAGQFATAGRRCCDRAEARAQRPGPYPVLALGFRGSSSVISASRW